MSNPVRDAIKLHKYSRIHAKLKSAQLESYLRERIYRAEEAINEIYPLNQSKQIDDIICRYYRNNVK